MPALPNPQRIIVIVALTSSQQERQVAVLDAAADVDVPEDVRVSAVVPNEARPKERAHGGVRL